MMAAGGEKPLQVFHPQRRNSRGARVTRDGLGPAGKLAQAFINSKLTPLVIVASILLGIGAVLLLPREEEPQIVVPMVDVFVRMPGASPTAVANRVTRPMGE